MVPFKAFGVIEARDSLFVSDEMITQSSSGGSAYTSCPRQRPIMFSCKLWQGRAVRQALNALTPLLGPSLTETYEDLWSHPHPRILPKSAWSHVMSRYVRERVPQSAEAALTICLGP